MKALQQFNDEYLDTCSKLSADQILTFLEDYRQLHASSRACESKLISLKVDTALLSAFKARCKLEGVKYQTKIKELMSIYLG